MHSYTFSFVTGSSIAFISWDLDLTASGTLPKNCYEMDIVRSANCSNTTLSLLAMFEVNSSTPFTVDRSPSKTEIFIEDCGMWIINTDDIVMLP